MNSIKSIALIILVLIFSFGCCCSQSYSEKSIINNTEKPLLTFVHLTDIHISNADWNQHWHWLFKLVPGFFDDWRENFSLAVQRINELKPSFVFLTGDLVMGGAEGGGNDEFKAVKDSLANIKVPLYIVPGDHDLGISAFASSVAKPEAIERYENIFGASYYSFDHDSLHFIGLNSSLFDKGLDSENEKQIEWLKSDLEKNRGKRIFLFFHRKDILEIIYPILKDYRIEAVFAGHIHRNSENEWNGIKVFTTNATSYTWCGPGYRIVEVYNHGIQTQTIDVNSDD